MRGDARIAPRTAAPPNCWRLQVLKIAVAVAAVALQRAHRLICCPRRLFGHGCFLATDEVDNVDNTRVWCCAETIDA